MSAALWMFNLAILRGTRNATSLPASADGRSPRVSPAGPMTGSFGPDRVRASRSASSANRAGSKTNGISGPNTGDSSVPAGPLSSWENKLRLRLALIGSTECLLTWKTKDTKQGRSFSRLVPSMPRTAANESGSSAMGTALWVTASARDWKDTPGMSTKREDGRSRVDQLPRQVAASLWATPLANLSIAASVAAALKEAKRLHPQGRWTLNTQVAELLDQLGIPHSGLSDTTGKLGGLNPEFVCWLMGFLPEWDDCAPTVTPSSRKKRQK